MGQPTVHEPPTVTVPCELGRHAGHPRGCRGQLVSLLVAPGTPCACDCHQDDAVERARAAFAELNRLTAAGVDPVAALDQAEAYLNREGAAA